MSGGLRDCQRRALVVRALVVMLLAVIGGGKVFCWGMNVHTADSILEGGAPPGGMPQGLRSFRTPEVKKVTDGITMAIGYALANSIWLEGPEGIVVVDVLESLEAAEVVYRDMRRYIKGPIKALVYTHCHIDHINGARAFIDDPHIMPEIWAHYNFEFEVDNVATTNDAFIVRGMRQFGAMLPRVVNEGPGVGISYNYRKTAATVFPNRIMETRDQNITIAGLTLELISIPGETDDQIGVWWADKRAFLCADDVYKSFPNLYAIRGVPNRNARKWIASLDRMRALRPEYLVPSHGQPLVGEKLIYDTLTSYRDALQYVHDQTVRFINRGWHPEDIARHIHLPDELAKEPYLIPIYGTVEWSVRSVFDQYMGWFSGRASEMAAITTKERAVHMVKLAGGVDKMLEAAKQAIEDEDYRWGLVLASHLLEVDNNNAEALDIRTEGLKGMARGMVSTNGRHYYLTTALEDHKFIQNRIPLATRKNLFDNMSISQLFMYLRTSLDPDKTKGLDLKLLFYFTDDEDFWLVHLRRRVLEVTHSKDNVWTLKVTLKMDTFRQLLLGSMNQQGAQKQGLLKLQGDTKDFDAFCHCFERK